MTLGGADFVLPRVSRVRWWLGDIGKVYCSTCHNGQNKPLNGVSMYKDYPELGAPRPPPPPTEEEAAAAAEAGAAAEAAP